MDTINIDITNIVIFLIMGKKILVPMKTKNIYNFYIIKIKSRIRGQQLNYYNLLLDDKVSPTNSKYKFRLQLKTVII